MNKNLNALRKPYASSLSIGLKAVPRYMKGLRVTPCWGITWITPVNYLEANFGIRVIIWLNIAGLGLTRQTARPPEQALQCRSLATW